MKGPCTPNSFCTYVGFCTLNLSVDASVAGIRPFKLDMGALVVGNPLVSRVGILFMLLDHYVHNF
jgi:hypothetical protein